MPKNEPSNDSPEAVVPVLSFDRSAGRYVTVKYGGAEALQRGVLWLARRGEERWQIGFDVDTEVLTLDYNGETIWSSPPGAQRTSSHKTEDRAAIVARLLHRSDFLAIVGQFDLGKAEVPGNAGAPSRLHSAGLRAWSALCAWACSPRAIARTGYRIVRAGLALIGLFFLGWWAMHPTGQQQLAAARDAAPFAVAGAAVTEAPGVPGALRSNQQLLVAPPGGVPPELADTSTNNQLTPTEVTLVVQAVQRSGIQLRGKGQPFIVFSDPNCPSCRDLDPKLLLSDPRFTPIIVPVAFKPGSDAAVQRIMCASDRVTAWSKAVNAPAPAAGAPADAAAAEACPGAADAVVKDNASFVALKFRSTPTIVSMTGKVVAGSAATVGELNDWLQANGGLPPEPTARTSSPAPSKAASKPGKAASKS